MATSAINVWFITRMLRERHDEAAFRVLPVRSDNEYLAYVLSVHRDDVRRHQPDFSWDGVPHQDRHPFLILRGDETVGVVIMRVADDVAHVELDYVTRRYRDFSPGRVRLAPERGAARPRHRPGGHVPDDGRPVLRTRGFPT